jgi:hypothetical protein
VDPIDRRREARAPALASAEGVVTKEDYLTIARLLSTRRTNRAEGAGIIRSDRFLRTKRRHLRERYERTYNFKRNR